MNTKPLAAVQSWRVATTQHGYDVQAADPSYICFYSRILHQAFEFHPLHISTIIIRTFFLSVHFAPAYAFHPMRRAGLPVDEALS